MIIQVGSVVAMVHALVISLNIARSHARNVKNKEKYDFLVK